MGAKNSFVGSRFFQKLLRLNEKGLPAGSPKVTHSKPIN